MTEIHRYRNLWRVVTDGEEHVYETRREAKRHLADYSAWLDDRQALMRAVRDRLDRGEQAASALAPLRARADELPTWCRVLVR